MYVILGCMMLLSTIGLVRADAGISGALHFFLWWRLLGKLLIITGEVGVILPAIDLAHSSLSARSKWLKKSANAAIEFFSINATKTTNWLAFPWMNEKSSRE